MPDPIEPPQIARCRVEVVAHRDDRRCLIFRGLNQQRMRAVGADLIYPSLAPRSYQHASVCKRLESEADGVIRFPKDVAASIRKDSKQHASSSFGLAATLCLTWCG